MTVKEFLDKLPDGWSMHTQIDFYSGSSLYPLGVIEAYTDTHNHITVELE